jgi:hypothetical protein
LVLLLLRAVLGVCRRLPLSHKLGHAFTDESGSSRSPAKAGSGPPGSPLPYHRLKTVAKGECRLKPGKPQRYLG